METVVTSNAVEVIKLKWDGERFALVHLDKEKSKVIILNPREMMDIVRTAIPILGKETQNATQ